MWVKLKHTAVRLLAISTIVICAPQSGVAAESATATVVINAHFASRTSLKISTDVLTFDATDSGELVTMTVDFSAAARTQAGAEVTLCMETLRAVERPSTAAAQPVLAFAGAGPGMSTGRITHGSSIVAGRWRGGGVRTGRLVFTLHAPMPGRYRVPVKFMLAAL